MTATALLGFESPKIVEVTASDARALADVYSKAEVDTAIAGVGGGGSTNTTKCLQTSGLLIPVDTQNWGVSSASASGNFISFFPFSKACTIQAIVMEVTSPAVAGSQTRAGLYTSNSTTNLPDTLVEEATAQSIASNGVKTFPFASNHAITDLMWLAVLHQATVSFRTGSVNERGLQMFGGTAVNSNSFNNRIGASFTFAALPANTSGLTLAASASGALVAGKLV